MTHIQAGDRVSIVSTVDFQRYFGTVSWVDGSIAAVWWDDLERGVWRGPVKWLERESN